MSEKVTLPVVTYWSLSPLLAVVYFFKTAHLFCIEIAKFEPVLAIFSRIYTLFGAPFTVIHSVVGTPQKLQISGMHTTEIAFFPATFPYQFIVAPLWFFCWQNLNLVKPFWSLTNESKCIPKIKEKICRAENLDKVQNAICWVLNYWKQKWWNNVASANLTFYKYHLSEVSGWLHSVTLKPEAYLDSS